MPRDLKAEREELRTMLAEPGAVCPNCAYDLTGLDSNWCPECGKLLSPRALRRQTQRRGVWTEPDDTARGSAFHFELSSRVVMLSVLGPLLLVWPLVQAVAPSPLLRWSPSGQADRMLLTAGFFVFWFNLVLPVTIARSPGGRPALGEAILQFTEWAGWAFMALYVLQILAALLS